MAAKRVRQFYKGAPTLVKADNKEIVMALREIAQGKVVPTTPLPALPEKIPSQAETQQNQQIP